MTILKAASPKDKIKIQGELTVYGIPGIASLRLHECVTKVEETDENIHLYIKLLGANFKINVAKEMPNTGFAVATDMPLSTVIDTINTAVVYNYKKEIKNN